MRSAVGRVFKWGAGSGIRLIPSNPFANVSVRGRRKVSHRDGPTFTDTQIATIFNACLAIPDAQARASKPDAARRWVPLIQAYTGSRPRAIVQLRAEDVITVDNILAFKLTPEAGSIKTRNTNQVPVHKHLRELGLLQYVQSIQNGALFYNQTGQGHEAEIKRTINAVTELTQWVRSLPGCSRDVDPELKASHAWRNTWRQRAADAGIEEAMRDAICGHAPASKGRHYEEPPLRRKLKAINKFPRYKF
jgi:integrase